MKNSFMSWRQVKQMQIVSAGIYPLEDIVVALTYALGELAYDDWGIRHPSAKAEVRNHEVKYTYVLQS
jgi:hypothetical protein